MNLTNGTLIRLARIGKGWTLQDLSNMCTYSISYLSKIENDERPVPYVIQQLLDVDNGPQWYFDIIDAVCNRDFPEDRVNKIISSFHYVLGLKSWQF